MGRSAKVHKRVKTASSMSQSLSSKPAAVQWIPPPPSRTSASASTSNPPKATLANSTVNSKRRSTLKQKAAGAVESSSSHQNQAGDGSNTNGHVLGGVDYVDLMLGSRRRAREEAKKLPSS